jgi:hypothetical protein
MMRKMNREERSVDEGEEGKKEWSRDEVGELNVVEKSFTQ